MGNNPNANFHSDMSSGGPKFLLQAPVYFYAIRHEAVIEIVNLLSFVTIVWGGRVA